MAEELDAVMAQMDEQFPEVEPVEAPDGFSLVEEPEPGAPDAPWAPPKLSEILPKDLLDKLPEGVREKGLDYLVNERLNAVRLAQDNGERANRSEARIEALERALYLRQQEQQQPPATPAAPKDPYEARGTNPATGWLEDSPRFFGQVLPEVMDERAQAAAAQVREEIGARIAPLEQTAQMIQIQNAHARAGQFLVQNGQTTPEVWAAQDTKDVIGKIMAARGFDMRNPNSFIDSYAVGILSGAIKPPSREESKPVPAEEPAPAQETRHAGPPHSTRASTAVNEREPKKGEIRKPEGMSNTVFQERLRVAKEMGLKNPASIRELIEGDLPIHAAGGYQGIGG